MGCGRPQYPRGAMSIEMRGNCRLDDLQMDKKIGGGVTEGFVLRKLHTREHRVAKAKNR